MNKHTTWLSRAVITTCLSIGGIVSSVGVAAPVELDVTLGTPVVRADERQTVFLKVGLTGVGEVGERDRVPVNVAIVLDRSGSMRGEKLAHARDAANFAIDQLDRADVAAVVSYDSVVRVDVPAGYVSDKATIRNRIKRISAGGKTALFAGVSKGAQEVRKYLSENRVNRVILLSDGIANIGPNSPSALGQLGASLSEDGMTISTIGLGLDYNEDLMAQLAKMSDGNHSFAETATDLVGIFEKEFGDVLSVVGQDVEIIIHCAQGIRPIRVLGREANISGGKVSLRLNQIYRDQEKFVLLELDVPAGPAGSARAVAGVEVDYINPLTRQREQLAASGEVHFSESEQTIADRIDAEVIAEMAALVANEMSREAVQLRDEGKVAEATDKLRQSAEYLDDHARRYNVEELSALTKEVEREAEDIVDEESWGKLRKSLTQKQHAVENQQRR